MAMQYLERDVDAIFFHIDRHILPEIGELQGSTSGVGQAYTFGVVVTAQPQNEPTYRIGGIAAVVEQLLVGLVARDSLARHERRNQIGDGLCRNSMAASRPPQLSASS